MDWRHSRPFRISLVLALLLLAVAAIVPRLIRLEALSNELSAGVMKTTGRTLWVGGGARVFLLPRPALVLGQIKFSEPHSARIFAEARELRANLAVWPLLQGKLVIRGLELESPQLTIVHREDGSYNFEDLLNTPSDHKISLGLEDLQFHDTTLRFSDQTQGMNVRVTALNLDLRDLSDSRDGQLDLAGTLLAGEEGQAAAWQGKMTAQAAVRYHPKEKQLRVADLKFNLAQQGKSDPTLNINDAQLQAEGKLVYGWNPLRLSGGELKVNSTLQRAGQKWSLALDLPEIRVNETALSLSKFQFQADMQSPRGGFSSKVRVPKFTGATEHLLKAESAEIAIHLKSPDQQVALNFASPLELEHLTTARLTGYKLKGSYGNRDLPRGAIPFDLEGRGDLNLRTESLLLDSHGKLDNADFTARVAMQDFINPHYALDLNLARLDLTPYLPVVAAGAKEINQEQAFDFWWLERLNATGHIRVGELILKKLHVNDLAFQLKAGERTLTLDPLEATLYEGKLSGRAEIDANLTNGRRAPSFRVQQKLSNMNINALLADILGSERFEGRGHLDLDIAAVGNKITDLRRTAGGNVKVVLNRGAMRGLDIEALVRATAAQLQKTPGQEKQKINLTSRTNFSELRANLLVRHGIATNNDLNVSTGLLKLTGNGFMDMGAGNMDYTIKAEANNKIPELKSIVGLTLPIQITGSLSAPEYNVDYASLKEQLLVRQQAANKKSTKR